MKHWIREIQDSGKLIVLDDSSKWEIGLYDSVDTRFWMKLDNVTVIGDKMTNHSQREKTVTVRRGM